MKEQMIRGVLTACLMTALGLAGCHTVGPGLHDASDRMGTVSQSQKPNGVVDTAPEEVNTNLTPPSDSRPTPTAEVPVSITRTVDQDSTPRSRIR